MTAQNESPKAPSRGRLHVLGIDAEIDPSIGQKLRRGIYATDRIHALVMGFPGCGKTRFLLSMIKQHIDNNEGFMVLDSHHDLVPLVLTHIPPEKWGRVIYINPWTAFEDKYDNRVVQINFLECKDKRDRDVVARMFMDTLEKIYDRWWGPRLDMILMNALYLLMEKDSARLPDLYKILADKEYRNMLIQKCNDDSVKTFWLKQYDRMPKDASVAVLTKIYRLVQERIIVPIFMAATSCIDFRKAMDHRKIIIVDLPEGKVTTDIANFVGSLILSRIYIAGMSREDTPEEQRMPFFVYVDEAYRYTTKSIPETLQSLRKFKVFMTLASQYLEQYRRDIQEALSQTCETIISFRVGEGTAKTLEKFYPKEFGYETLMRLPRHLFFVSTPFCGNREYQVLETLDYQTGPSDPEAIIKMSLSLYGREINIDALMGQIKRRTLQEEFLDWPVTPAEWVILLQIRLMGSPAKEDELRTQLLYDKTKANSKALTEIDFANALRNLSVGNMKREAAWLKFKIQTVQQYREETYAFGKKIVRAQGQKTRLWSIDLTDRKAKRLLDNQFRGYKSGDIPHIRTIAALHRSYWRNGYIVQVDTGETDESIADLYATPLMCAQGVEGAKGYIDPDRWDYERSFAVEVESYPQKHWDRVKGNYERNKKMGFPTVFVVATEALKEELKKKLAGWKATVVATSINFEPGHPEMASVIVAETLRDLTGKPTEEEQADEAKQTQTENQTRPDTQATIKQDSTEQIMMQSSAVVIKEKEKTETETEIKVDKLTETQGKIESAQAYVTDSNKDALLNEQLKSLRDCELVTRENEGKIELVAMKTLNGKTILVNLGLSSEFSETVKALSEKLQKPQAKDQSTKTTITQLENAPLYKQGKQSQPTLEKRHEIDEAKDEPSEKSSQPEAEVEAEPEKTAVTYREDLVKELAASGWRFTLKVCREKTFLYARKGRNQNKSLGEFNEEAKNTIAKLSLKVNGLNK